MTTFTLPIDYLIALQLFGLILVVWLFTWHMSRSFPTLHNKRICLLIAHPDDEAMFFGPAVQWLTRPELGNQLLILCLSSGDAAGLGHIRKTELRHSALLLGVKSPDHVVVIEDAAKLPDSMTAVWDPKLIASILTRYFAPTLAGAPTTAAPPASLDFRPPRRERPPEPHGALPRLRALPPAPHGAAHGLGVPSAAVHAGVRERVAQVQ